MDTVHYLNKTEAAPGNERTHPPFPYDVILTIRHGTGFAHKAVDRSGQRLLRPFRKSGTGECRMLFRNVVIFGAGTMGHAIALRFARVGDAVTLTDVDRDALDRAELVVEVISERVDIKRRFYEELAGVVSPSALIASNTSVLDIFEHAPSVLHPQLIMAHYFVPAHIIPLVEIVGHPSNPGQLVPQFAACLSALGMKPVVLKRFARGFIVNRIQRAINQELFQLLDEGVADAAALDDAVSVCLGARLAVMGYLSRLDFTGLDLVLSNYRQVPMGLATDETPPPLLERMVGEGRLGFKSGKGFYGYSGVTSEEVLRHRDARLLAVFRSLETINARFPSPTLEPANGGAWQNGPSSQKDEDT